MATALQSSDVDLSLDLSPDTYGNEFMEYSDADANQDSQQIDSEAKSPMPDSKNTAQSIGEPQQLDIGNPHDQDEEINEQYNPIPDAMVGDKGPDAPNNVEWEIEADSNVNADVDATSLHADLKDGQSLVGDSDNGLKQTSDKYEEAVAIADNGEAQEAAGQHTRANAPSGVEIDQPTGQGSQRDGTNDDFFHEIDYDDEDPSRSEEAAVEKPLRFEEKVAGDSETTASDPSLVTKQADAAGLIDEYHRSLQDQALDEILQADSSAVSLDTPGNGDDAVDLPEVIVSWHGVEYPMFYDSPGSEGKQCFFEDAGLLQCAIEELLASFRQELSSDLAGTDELVLQVNEMGLEFAESSNPENFRDITLGSIMQVFNDLVRNKDPEASRPLYAFLITRPKCSTRWQSLIEDAYQGKNIDEVSIRFPMDQAVMDKDTEQSGDAEGSVEDQDDAMDFDEYFAGEDAPEGDALATEEGSVNALTEVDKDDQLYNEAEPIEHDGAGDDGDVGQESSIARETPAPSGRSLSETGDSEVDQAVVEVALDNELADQNDDDDDDDEHGNGDDDEVGDKEQTYTEDGEENAHEEQLDVPQDDAADTAFPYLDEITENADANALDSHQVQGHDDSPDDIGHAIFDLNEMPHDEEPSDTSATATLDGDDHLNDFNADIDFDADISRDLDLQVAPATGQEGELDEIDWRDYAGQDDADDLQDATTPSAKRPRSDEDDALDAEDGKDIKRRRSEA